VQGTKSYAVLALVLMVVDDRGTLSILGHQNVDEAQDRIPFALLLVLPEGACVCKKTGSVSTRPGDRNGEYTDVSMTF
jgi:hypothetical protein